MAETALVADIGGTNARFALARRDGDAVVIKDPQRYQAKDFATVVDAARAYVQAVGVAPRRACFAVASPVDGDEVAFTNSPWKFRKSEVTSALGLDAFCVVNDFYALASGVASLPDDAFETLKDGTPVNTAPVLVIGPGTGLGQALIVPAGSTSVIVPTEGGHVTFAPQGEAECAIARYLARTHARVSIERVLSGAGLSSIYSALRDSDAPPVDARDITAAARSGSDPIASRTVDMFFAILGRAAGDAALGAGARGGVVFGGGILPKIREMLPASRFVEEFNDKGRMTPYVAAIPVRLIVAEGTALLGAAMCLEDL